MALKQSIYQVTKTSGEDTIHFQTDDQMVKVINSSGQTVGSLKELVFEGKRVTSGSYTSIKLAGTYYVSGVTGLPVSTSGILEVSTFGAVNNPTVIAYTFKTDGGEIYNNIIKNGVAKGWTSAGVNSDNSMTIIRGNIGTLSGLKTNSKTSLVNAVNEVKIKADANEGSINSISKSVTELKAHNHDDKYLLKSGDTISGNLRVRRNNGIKSTNASGGEINIATANADGVVLGVGTENLKLMGKDISFNGRKVWTADNDGKGSGLDADKLGGVDSSLFSRRDTANTYSSKQSFNGGVAINGALDWAGRANITVDSSGRMRFDMKGTNDVFIDSNGNIKTSGAIVLTNENSRYNSLRFSSHGSNKGVGFELDKDSNEFYLNDWDNKNMAFSFNTKVGVVKFNRRIQVQGRELYLQSAQPTGKIPTGSIWIS